MLTLGIDTSVTAGSIAIVENGRVLYQTRTNPAQSHTPQLMSLINRGLKSSALSVTDIGLFAVSIGPGSFTGLRIGLAAAQGFAFVTEKPIVGVSTLEAIALLAGRTDKPVCAVIDARKKQVFAGAYKLVRMEAGNMIEEIMAPMAAEPESVCAKLHGPVVFAGNGIDQYGKTLLENAPAGSELVSFGDSAGGQSETVAACVAKIAGSAGAVGTLRLMEPAGPLYLRPSDAEFARKGN